MTGSMQKNNRHRPVNRRIFKALFVVIVLLGSFCIREIYGQHHIVQKLFGGINILLFWVILFSILYIIEKNLFKRNGPNKNVK